MFTGIINDIGEIISVERRADVRVEIACRFMPDTIAVGASINCAGICLTVTAKRELREGGAVFSIDASAETLARTTLGRWKAKSRVNLERALKVGDELGGHIVTGHVDGIATITRILSEGASKRFTLKVPRELSRFIAPKGSVCLDGTALTVNETRNGEFGVNFIPHTLAVTTWGQSREGDLVNVEIDVLARYVARLQEFSTP